MIEVKRKTGFGRRVDPPNGTIRILLSFENDVARRPVDYVWPASPDTVCRTRYSSAAIAELFGPFDVALLVVPTTYGALQDELEGLRRDGHVGTWSMVEKGWEACGAGVLDVVDTVITVLKETALGGTRCRLVVDVTGADKTEQWATFAALSYIVTQEDMSIERVLSAEQSSARGDFALIDLTPFVTFIEWTVAVAAFADAQPTRRLARLFRDLGTALSYSEPTSLSVGGISDHLERLNRMEWRTLSEAATELLTDLLSQVSDAEIAGAFDPPLNHIVSRIKEFLTGATGLALNDAARRDYGTGTDDDRSEGETRASLHRSSGG